MNKLVTQVLKHLAREFVNHPEVRKKAEQLARSGYVKAGDVAKAGYAQASAWITKWGSKKNSKAVPTVRQKPSKSPRRKTKAKK